MRFWPFKSQQPEEVELVTKVASACLLTGALVRGRITLHFAEPEVEATAQQLGAEAAASLEEKFRRAVSLDEFVGKEGAIASELQLDLPPNVRRIEVTGLHVVKHLSPAPQQGGGAPSKAEESVATPRATPSTFPRSPTTPPPGVLRTPQAQSSRSIDSTPAPAPVGTPRPAFTIPPPAPADAEPLSFPQAPPAQRPASRAPVSSRPPPPLSSAPLSSPPPRPASTTPSPLPPSTVRPISSRPPAAPATARPAPAPLTPSSSPPRPRITPLPPRPLPATPGVGARVAPLEREAAKPTGNVRPLGTSPLAPPRRPGTGPLFGHAPAVVVPRNSSPAQIGASLAPLVADCATRILVGSLRAYDAMVVRGARFEELGPDTLATLSPTSDVGLGSYELSRALELQRWRGSCGDDAIEDVRYEARVCALFLLYEALLAVGVPQSAVLAVLSSASQHFVQGSRNPTAELGKYLHLLELTVPAQLASGVAEPLGLRAPPRGFDRALTQLIARVSEDLQAAAFTIELR